MGAANNRTLFTLMHSPAVVIRTPAPENATAVFDLVKQCKPPGLKYPPAFPCAAANPRPEFLATRPIQCPTESMPA